MKTAISFLLAFALAVNAHADSFCVDAKQSKFTIHVGSAGVFGAFGHDHLIEARGISGCAEIDWSHVERSSVSLIFSAADIQVVDPDHPNDRPKVQDTMASQVLRTRDFPEIRFVSERVRESSTSASTFRLIVNGPLSLRGRTQNVSIPIVLERLTSNTVKVSGRYTLKQSAFGITPIRVMGGVVRVKDEIQLEFELHLK